MKYNNLKYIFYEWKFYKIHEEEYDHYHLSNNDLDIVKKNEVIKILPFIGISKYSKKRQIKKLIKLGKKILSDLEKTLKK